MIQKLSFYRVTWQTRARTFLSSKLKLVRFWPFFDFKNFPCFTKLFMRYFNIWLIIVTFELLTTIVFFYNVKAIWKMFVQSKAFDNFKISQLWNLFLSHKNVHNFSPFSKQTPGKPKIWANPRQTNNTKQQFLSCKNPIEYAEHENILNCIMLNSKKCQNMTTKCLKKTFKDIF